MALLCLAVVPARVARADDATSATDATGAAPRAPADARPSMRPDAKAHYDSGLARYAARDFAAAIRELEQGYALDPRPEFLFAEAQSFRLGGDCARAVPLYERFLAADPTPIQIEATRLALSRCPLEHASPPTTTTTATATTTTPAPAATGAVTATDRRPRWWADPWALSSLGVGVAAVGVGIGFAVASDRARDAATSPSTMSYAEFTRLWDSAQHRRTIAIATVAAGSALIAAGAVRLIVLGRREGSAGMDAGTGASARTSPPSRARTSPLSGLSLAIVPGGAAALWEGGY